jgi:hypothetical protein
MTRAALYLIIIGGLILGTLLFAQQGSAQCVKHPEGHTAVILNNETAYDLTFFIDDVDKGLVIAGGKSPEIIVVPGEHLFGARAVIQGQGFWVMVVNEVFEGELCTWTLLDPPESGRPPEFRLASRRW